MLDPAYLDDLEARSVDDLRAMHAECLELETEVSYVRRLTQARIDILEAELGRRASGGTLEDLINALPADPRRPRPSGRPGEQPPPPADGARPGQRVGSRARGVRRPARQPSDPRPTTELVDAIDRLRSLERDVSDQRRALFG